jgi:hypothetical protein
LGSTAGQRPIGHASEALRIFAHVEHLQIEHCWNTPPTSFACSHPTQTAVLASISSTLAPPAPMTALAIPAAA